MIIDEREALKTLTQGHGYELVTPSQMAERIRDALLAPGYGLNIDPKIAQERANNIAAALVKTVVTGG